MTQAHKLAIDLAATEQGLQVIEITYGMNGYPSRIGDVGIIGFDNFEQAEKFAKDNGGEPHYFQTKNGWHFWEAKGWANKPYSIDDYLNDLGDGYMIAESVAERAERMKEALNDLIDEWEGGFNRINEYISEQEELQAKIEAADEDESVITYLGAYHSTCKDVLMNYHEDCTSVAIGVLITSEPLN